MALEDAGVLLVGTLDALVLLPCRLGDLESLRTGDLGTRLVLLVLVAVFSSCFPINGAESARAMVTAFILASFFGETKTSSCIMGFHMVSILEEFPSDADVIKVDAESCMAINFFLAPTGVDSGVCAGVNDLVLVFLTTLD